MLKQRVDAINQLRVDRALSMMMPSFKKVYSLLPTLLHYHHPLIPGYIDGNVPTGICFYTPNAIQQYYFQEFEFYHGLLSQKSIDSELPITGIYSMGSTSSVGQNFFSDLDIWVFHQAWLNNEERKLLQNKCNILEKWAASLGIEVKFFLIDENRFRYYGKGNSLNYISIVQHTLLLDEFYRTAVRLAGKRILWNLIPDDKEEYYDDYVRSLYAKGVIVPREWLNLGGLNSLSIKEYLSESFWKFENIHSLYKTILKTLLLEAYFLEYPSPRLLAKDIKNKLHSGEIVSFGLDPYCMMLDRITKYLKTINDISRLDLIRRCFYLKVCEKISRTSTYIGWRRAVMSQLIKEWDWDNDKLNMLDNYANWKREQVHESHSEIFNAIMQSYRNIMRFAYNNNLESFCTFTNKILKF